MIVAIRTETKWFARIAAVATLIGVASASRAADFQIDNLKLDLGAMTIAAPRIDVKGSPLEREAFIALFNANSSESAAARMSRLAADEISAPEFVMEQKFGPQRQITTYRALRLSAIRDGRIGRGEVAGGTIAVSGTANGTMSGEIKRISFEGFDLQHTTRVLTERSAPGVSAPFQPLFARFEQDGYVLDMGKAGKMSMGKAIGRAFSARVAAEPLGEVLSRIATLSDTVEKTARKPAGDPAADLTPADKQLGLAMLTLFDSFDYGSGEVRDVAIAMTPPPAAGAPVAPVDFSIGRLAYGEDTAAKSGFALEGLSFASGGAKGTVALLAYSGFSIGPALKELHDALARNETDADIRKWIPILGTIQMKGMSVDAPQEAAAPAPGTWPGAKPAAPPTIKVGLGNFELRMSDQVNGVPSKIALTLDNLTAPIVDTPQNPGAKDLIAMGFSAIDVSMKLDLAWEALRNELAIRSLSLSGAGMGRLDASATLGNVTKDLFASDLALAQVAALGATVRALEVKLQNLGAFEKILANEARKAKRKPEELRRDYAMMASLGLASILGPSDAAKTLTSAISRFVAKPGTLTVSATSKSAGGLGLADVIAIGDPTEIFGKIDLKADAQ